MTDKKMRQTDKQRYRKDKQMQRFKIKESGKIDRDKIKLKR